MKYSESKISKGSCWKFVVAIWSLSSAVKWRIEETVRKAWLLMSPSISNQTRMPFKEQFVCIWADCYSDFHHLTIPYDESAYKVKLYVEVSNAYLFHVLRTSLKYTWGNIVTYKSQYWWLQWPVITLKSWYFCMLKQESIRTIRTIFISYHKIMYA